MKSDRLSSAIGKIDDRFVAEAFEYRPRSGLHRSIRMMGAAAACICLLIGMAVPVRKSRNASITVYAYESDRKLANGEAVLMPGRIDDNGQMQGHPLMFYILGQGIESIRFSCRNERISFVDWTERRGDYGLSGNFTVPYGGQEEDYYYLVVDWVPDNIIRKLTDHKDITISDLTQEEKEDVIVMEVVYLDGRTETAAIWISLENSGNFEVSTGSYQITDEDEFIFRPDSLPTEHQP